MLLVKCSLKVGVVILYKFVLFFSSKLFNGMCFKAQLMCCLMA